MKFIYLIILLALVTSCGSSNLKSLRSFSGRLTNLSCKEILLASTQTELEIEEESRSTPTKRIRALLLYPINLIATPFTITDTKLNKIDNLELLEKKLITLNNLYDSKCSKEVTPQNNTLLITE